MENLFVASAIMGGLGLFFGIILAVAYRFLKVESNPRIEQVEEFLPAYTGHQVIMPREATTISGFDFDIDKLFSVFPEYNVRVKTSAAMDTIITEMTKEFNEVMPGLTEFSRRLLGVYDFYKAA